MKFPHEFFLEKKLGKYLFSKDLKIPKRNKSRSPSSSNSADDIENLKIDKKLDLFDKKDNNKLFGKNHILFESKLKMNENPFLSSVKKSQNFTNKSLIEKGGNVFMKLSSKIIINDNVSDFIENNLFDDAFINSDIFTNNEILNNDLKNNKINNDKKEETQKNPLIAPAGNIIDKEKIVIEALAALDKDYMNNKDKNLVMIKLEDFDIEKNYFEEIFEINTKESDSEEKKLEYKQKKHVYETIDNRIKLYYNYYRKNKSYKINETEIELNNYKKEITDILAKETLNEKYLFFGFKSIVINLYLLIIRRLSNSHFKIYLNSIKEDNINLDIFIELMEKYNTLKDICPFLEKDFKEIIEIYQQKKGVKFCLCELLTDLYWDYVFKIHKINNMFISCYKLDNIKKNVIFEEAKHAMKSIIDILIVNDTSYKKNIGEQLKLPYMKQENLFLMCYINKSKKIVNPFEIKNPFIERIDKNMEKENSKSEKINSTEVKNTSLLNFKDTEQDKKAENNKNPENLSLEEVYKYIVGDMSNENKKHKKKNRKKKKKNKTEEIQIVQTFDPIVDEFIQYFIEFNKNNCEHYTKIRPNISEEWIKSLS